MQQLETYGQKNIIAKAWRTIDKHELYLTLEDGSTHLVETKYLPELHIQTPEKDAYVPSAIEVTATEPVSISGTGSKPHIIE